MVRSKRFEWGTPYLLTDLKEGVFKDEPAVCVGKKDSDMMRPTICAVCGQPLGARGYTTFCVSSIDGNFIDVMIGGGCIRERIKEKKIGENTVHPYNSLREQVRKFPASGRWYGTFLHHCIAKPYIRNKDYSKNWDDSVLNLPGVRFIIEMIDGLRDHGWRLDAEMRIENGEIDLLATHPDHGTRIYDWKSDLRFGSHDAYVKQVNEYMSELVRAGYPNVSGYILWVRNGSTERVPYTGDTVAAESIRFREPSLPVRCTLTIGLDKKEAGMPATLREYSHHRIYGDQVTFYIPPCTPLRDGFDFDGFEAPPSREGDRPQEFSWQDAEKGIHVSFICSKKRHVFVLTPLWRATDKSRTTLNVQEVINFTKSRDFTIHGVTGYDAKGKYIDVDTDEITSQLEGDDIISIDVDGGWGSIELVPDVKEITNALSVRIRISSEDVIPDVTVLSKPAQD